MKNLVQFEQIHMFNKEWRQAQVPHRQKGRQEVAYEVNFKMGENERKAVIMAINTMADRQDHGRDWCSRWDLSALDLLAVQAKKQAIDLAEKSIVFHKLRVFISGSDPIGWDVGDLAEKSRDRGKLYSTRMPISSEGSLIFSMAQTHTRDRKNHPVPFGTMLRVMAEAIIESHTKCNSVSEPI